MPEDRVAKAHELIQSGDSVDRDEVIVSKLADMVKDEQDEQEQE